MNKLQIAEELQKNTTNIYGKNHIKEYIANMNGYIEGHVSEGDFDIRDVGIALDLCFTYIVKERFDIKDWYLFEIPIENVYVFANVKKSEVFDLVVSNDGQVFPSYIDSNSTQQHAISIKEAIGKYVIPA